ncbi:helix-hairpin-helix domain-containing protein [Sphaerisporangium aureirubrum]|uniref:Helix-hairpin-helix domain-containing protein n=1 Tax=Sphaerisporangium aureirubrum TaxID=1544736 RepID=A0ABW1NW78_9ACTN
MAGLLALLTGGVYLWRTRPVPDPLPLLPVATTTFPAALQPSSGTSTPAGPALPVAGPAPVAQPPPPGASGAPTAQVVVHVTGKVRRPGLVTLPMGARVADAVTAAGGFRAGVTATGLNLARRLTDGEQIIVGAKPGTLAPPPPAPDPAAAPPPPLDLNTATAGQLETLPGVGEVLATRITEFRQTHGGFRSVDQLRDVTGIGERKYADLRPRVRV